MPKETQPVIPSLAGRGAVEKMHTRAKDGAGGRELAAGLFLPYWTPLRQHLLSWPPTHLALPCGEDKTATQRNGEWELESEVREASPKSPQGSCERIGLKGSGGSWLTKSSPSCTCVCTS